MESEGKTILHKNIYPLLNYSFKSCPPNCKKVISMKSENSSTSVENNFLCLEVVKAQRNFSNDEGTKITLLKKLTKEILRQRSQDVRRKRLS